MYRKGLNESLEEMSRRLMIPADRLRTYWRSEGLRFLGVDRVTVAKYCPIGCGSPTARVAPGLPILTRPAVYNG